MKTIARKIMETSNDNLETFDGELIHPSLDVKNGILVLGFRYRIKPQEEKEIFLLASNGVIQLTDKDLFTIDGKSYFIEKRGRKLMRLEEKWSTTAMRTFLKGHAEIKPIANPNVIFGEVIELLKRYVELEQEQDYHLLVAWVIGTYFYPIFYAYPFLHIKAPKRSGKSQLLNLLAQLCFNAVKARPSLAALSDTVDALRGTYLIDQADALERKGNEDLLAILADSYKKSGGKRRIINFDKSKKREVLELETFSPKAFASIRELPEDLRDRCLIVPLIRSQNNFPDPDDANENWREVRGKIYEALISNYDLIASSYTVKKILYKKDRAVLGRTLELWLPIEVILECFGMRNIAETKKHFLAQYGFSEYEPSQLEEETIKVLLACLQDKSEAVLTPKEISELIDGGIFSPSDTSKQKAAKVGWAIKKFNLASEKKSRTKEGVRYLFEKSRVESIHNSYFKIHTEPTFSTPTDESGLNVQEIPM